MFRTCSLFRFDDAPRALLVRDSEVGGYLAGPLMSNRERGIIHAEERESEREGGGKDGSGSWKQSNQLGKMPSGGSSARREK